MFDEFEFLEADYILNNSLVNGSEVFAISIDNASLDTYFSHFKSAIDRLNTMIEKFNILSLDFDKLELNIAKLEELELIESWDHMV